MATASLPAATPVRVRARAVLGILRSVVTIAAGAAVTPHKAALSNLASMPLTLAGVACLDFAAFHYVHMIGWAVTGLSLVVLEHLIADEQ